MEEACHVFRRDERLMDIYVFERLLLLDILTSYCIA